MNKCSKCGAVISDNDNMAWKCMSCGKAFKVNLSKLKQVQAQKDKPENTGKMLLKCPACGNGMDDGNEKIACKCSACGNVSSGNLKYFADEEKLSVKQSAFNTHSGLIKCPECGGKVSDKALVCVHCGYPLHESKEEQVQQIQYCTYCGKSNSIESNFCGYCGKSFAKREEKYNLVINSSDTEVMNIMDYKNDLDLPTDIVRLQQAQIIQQQRQLDEQRRQFDTQAKCPKCGSISLSGGKQGFGVGKAVAGAVLLGGVGLLAGGIGANKTVITCMNCGYKFKF